jgi:hypothetical protein
VGGVASDAGQGTEWGRGREWGRSGGGRCGVMTGWDTGRRSSDLGFQHQD